MFHSNLYLVYQTASTELKTRRVAEPTRSVWPIRLVLLAGTGVLTLGLVVMISWHAGNLVMIRPLPTAAPMYYNTALCFVLSGIGLLAVATKRDRLTRLIGGLVGVLSGLTFSQYLFGVDLGIDQAFMTDWVGFGSLPPGRMAPVTTVGFALSGLSLMNIKGSMGRQPARSRALAGVAGMVVLTLGLVTLGLYVTDLMTVEGWGRIAQPMAVHTALGLTFVGAGFLSRVWQKEKQQQSHLASWLPTVAGVSLLITTLLLWQALLMQQQDFPVATRTVIPTVVLGGGVLLAIFVSVILVLAQRARRQAWEITLANYALQQEVAAREQMAAALQESENRFRLFMDHSPIIAWLKDTQGRYVYFNQTYERRFGVRSAEGLGKTDGEFRTPEEADIFRKNDQAVLAAGRPIEDIEEILNPDGTWCTWWTFKFPFQDAAKKQYVAGIGVDITSRKQAEEALRTLNAELDQRIQERTAALDCTNAALQMEIAERVRTEEVLQKSEEASLRLAAIVASSEDAIISKSLDGIVTSWNAAAERMFGYRAEEMIGQPILRLLPNDRHGEEEKILERLRRGESVDHIETVRRTKDGRLINVSLTISPLRNARGTIIGASKIARDITTRKQAETALAQYARDLVRINADLRQLAYVSAHDLQEPARQMGLYAQKLAKYYRDTRDVETAEAMDFIIEASQRMAAQFNDLIHYLEVDENSQEVTTTECNCEEVLRRALEALREPITASEATVTHEPLPTIDANAAQLQLVFQELLDNALKFRNSAPPRVHVWAEHEECGWRFAVHDNGIGIDPQWTGQLFGLFRRLHPRRQYAGTGMGLAICRKIVERHGGRIWVESQLGQGATFLFTISDRKEKSKEW